MSTRERILKFVKEAQPYLAVILLQFGYAGSAIIAKSALNHGMSHFTFAVYRNVFATFVFAPFAMVLERSCNIFMQCNSLFYLDEVIFVLKKR